MSDYEQRNHDFSKGITDAQCAYIEAERRVNKLQAENTKLRELVQDILRNMHGCTFHHSCGSCDFDECVYEMRIHELGIEDK